MFELGVSAVEMFGSWVQRKAVEYDEMWQARQSRRS